MNDIILSQKDLDRLDITTQKDLDLYQNKLNDQNYRERKPFVRVRSEIELPGISLMMENYIKHKSEK